MATLYRKYRPKAFEEIVGQEHITSTLAAALEKQRVAHAYLFHGARGTGKTTTARVLATSLGVAALDVVEIDAASNRGIDDIRNLRDGVALSPTSGVYKVYIIDEVHMLTKEAFAALLKTLEEPVKHAVFILATTELHKVPATIVSRCQTFRFRRATPENMRQRLTTILKSEKRVVDDSAMEFLIARSDGCYRDAESLLGQVLTWKEGKITAEGLTEFLGLPPRELLEKFLQALIERNAQAALAATQEVYTAGIDMEPFAQEVIREARDKALRLTLLAQSKPEDLNTLVHLPVIIRALLQAIQDLAYVPEPRLALQLAVLSVCQGSRVGPRTADPYPSAKAEVLPLRKGEKKVNAAIVGKRFSSPYQGEVAQRSEARGVNSQQLSKVWPQLIVNVKAKNPVASTFLRAIEPMGMSGEVVTVRVQYALHRNFFEKPGNRALVDEELGKLLDQTVTVRYQLEESSPNTRQQEEDLYKAVKEVFAQE